MKTLLPLTFILFITMLSCNTSDDIEINDVNESVITNESIAFTVNQNIINDLINGNFDDEKVVYSTLNSKEKLFLWDEKLGTLVQDARFNQVQIKLLYEFKNLLSEEFFENEDINFTNQQLKFEELESKAKVLFEKELAFKLFYTPQNINNNFTKNLGTVTSIGNRPKCNCSKLDDWCFGPGSDCDSSDCISKNGCGFFLMRRCDGECS